jgi:hypothetical protein
MTNLTTQQHYEVPGGTLRVILTTDHTLSTAERDELDQIADACQSFAAHDRTPRRAPAPVADPAVEVDEAIWELGGDQEIMAG